MNLPDRPTLNYATPDAPDDAAPWRAMRAWRATAGWALVLTPVGFGVHGYVGLIAGAALVLAVVMSLFHMTVAAAREFDAGYAVRHLVLATLLLPVLLAGLFLVTRLVEADRARARLAEEAEAE